MKKTSNKLLALLLTLVMAISCVAPALAAETVEPFAYSGDEVAIIKADGTPMGMMSPDSDKGQAHSAVIDGDNVIVRLEPKKTTYVALHWGAITDEDLTADVNANDDGTYDITLLKSVCGLAIPVAPLKSDGTTTKEQYYLAIPAEDKLSGQTPEEPAPEEPAPEEPTPEEPAPEEPTPAGERIELTITNNTKMFNVVTAYLETGEGGTVLVVALNGTGYKNLFKGTYEEAAANGDNRDNWIQGYENDDGKLEFRIPVAEGESFIPVVAISQSYLDKYEAGQNSLERAFYPRQMVLDREAGTLVTGDYEDSQELTVTNNVKMFKVSGATLDTVGGPNSNNYKASLMLTMGSDSFDKAFIGRASAVDEEAVIAIGEGRVFDLPMKWVETFGQPETLKSLLDGPFVVSFHSVSKDAWYERQFTVSEKEGTLVIDEAPAEEITYTFVSGGDGTWTKGSGEDFEIIVKRSVADDTTFSRFQGVTVDDKALGEGDYEAAAGSVKITVKSAYLETLAAGEHTVAVAFDDASAETTLTVAEAAEAGGEEPAPSADDSPKTGDPGVAVWCAMAAVSAAGAFALKRKKDGDAA